MSKTTKHDSDSQASGSSPHSLGVGRMGKRTPILIRSGREDSERSNISTSFSNSSMISDFTPVEIFSFSTTEMINSLKYEWVDF